MPNLPTHRAAWCLAVAFVAVFFAACSHDDPAGVSDVSDQSAPALPNLSSMTMDLSFFEQTTAQGAGNDNGKPVPQDLAVIVGKENFIAAAVRVALVHRVFCEALQAPVAAFALAIHAVPQRQADRSWLWTYLCVDNDIEYNIYLFGANAGDRTLWRMEVSTNNPEMPLNHFVWFDGEALRYESRGYWQFYEPVLDGSPLGPPAMAPAAADTPGRQSIRMDWANLTGNIHQLTILNNNPDSEGLGDEVAFHASPADNYLMFADASDPTTVYSIVWYADGSGSIQVPDYPERSPGQKSCWDTDQFDVVCPDV